MHSRGLTAPHLGLCDGVPRAVPCPSRRLELHFRPHLFPAELGTLDSLPGSPAQAGGAGVWGDKVSSAVANRIGSCLGAASAASYLHLSFWSGAGLAREALGVIPSHTGTQGCADTLTDTQIQFPRLENGESHSPSRHPGSDDEARFLAQGSALSKVEIGGEVPACSFIIHW